MQLFKFLNHRICHYISTSVKKKFDRIDTLFLYDTWHLYGVGMLNGPIWPKPLINGYITTYIVLKGSYGQS